MVISLTSLYKKRIDELGRVVIPKQIRNTLKIDDFDELDIIIQSDSILLKKTNELYCYKDKLNRLLEFIKKFFDYDICIINKNNIISTTSDSFKCEAELLVNLDLNVNKVVYYDEINISNVKLRNKYIYNEALIIDSNILGYILIISDEKLYDKLTEIKKIKNIIVDLISYHSIMLTFII